MTIIYCIFIGDILEVGVQCSIAMHDIPSFERYMAQLKCYYLDYRYATFYKTYISNIE